MTLDIAMLFRSEVILMMLASLPAAAQVVPESPDCGLQI